jgi:2-methylcitrate dehydratase PrpD
MTTGTSACARLAERLTSIDYEELDEATLDRVRRRIFDTAAAARAGAVVASVHALDDPLIAGTDPGVLMDLRRIAASVRATEVDDIHIGTCVTAGAVAVPAALAVGAATGADDRRVIEGVVAGYEALVRFGAAIDGARRVYAGVWTTYLAAPIGAAAATGRLLGLDPAAMADALAIAATRAAGVGGNPPRDPPSRWLSFGAAATDGVLAAVAARNGLAGDPRVFEVGLPRAVQVEFDPELFAAAPGHSWAVDEMDAKPFCSARQTLSAIEAAQGAADQLAPGGLRRIEVRVPGYYRSMIDHADTHTRLGTIASAQYQVAVALRRPASLYDVERSEPAIDETIASIMRIVEVLEDSELATLYPRQWGARVTIEATTGETATRVVHDPRGCAARPLSWEDLRDKHARIAPEYDLDPLLAACRGFGLDAAAPPAATAILDEAARHRRPARP